MFSRRLTCAWSVVTSSKSSPTLPWAPCPSWYMCNGENNLASNVQLATHPKPLYSARHRQPHPCDTHHIGDDDKSDDFHQIINIWGSFREIQSGERPKGMNSSKAIIFGQTLPTTPMWHPSHEDDELSDYFHLKIATSKILQIEREKLHILHFLGLFLVIFGCFS